MEAQAFPTTNTPELMDVLIWVISYLEPNDKKLLRRIGRKYQYGPEFGPLWLTRPWSPNRRRRWGFGVPDTERTVVNDKPPVHLIIHFVWGYLEPEDRKNMANAAAPWYLYQKLRVRAIKAPLSELLQKHPPPETPKKLLID
jgi:hypothetical protein